MKIADDFEAIKRHLAELEHEHLEIIQRQPWCERCANTGWARRVTKDGWVRETCPVCNNPHNLP